MEFVFSDKYWMDQLSKILFPFTFLFFNVGFWCNAYTHRVSVSSISLEVHHTSFIIASNSGDHESWWSDGHPTKHMTPAQKILFNLAILPLYKYTIYYITFEYTEYTVIIPFLYFMWKYRRWSRWVFDLASFEFFLFQNFSHFFETIFSLEQRPTFYFWTRFQFQFWLWLCLIKSYRLD